MPKRPPKTCACGAEFTPKPNNYAKALRCPTCAAARRRSGSPERKERETHRAIANQLYSFWDGEGVNDQHEVPEFIETMTAHECSDGSVLYLPTTNEVASIVERHNYAYMAAGFSDGRPVERLEREPGRDHLGTNEILWWLWKLPKSSRWGYSLGYDWSMIFVDLIKDEDDLRQLWQIYHPEVDLDGNARDPFEPVWWNGWGITKTLAAVELCRYVVHPAEHWTSCKPTCKLEPGKELKLSKFFQDGFKCWGGGSFLSQITNWKIGTEDQRAEVEAMKKERAHFTSLTERIKRYCDLEVTLGSELAKAQVSTASELGIRPRKGRWYSTGSGAKALLRKHHVADEFTFNEQGERVLTLAGARGPDRYADAPQRLRPDLMRTFFGGRFELRLTGFFAKLFLKDFASAYPAVIRDLPCMAHGHWEDHYVPGAVNFGRVGWEPNHDGDTDFGPFPWRYPNQRIYYPEIGEGVYCEVEIEAARNLPGFTVEVDSWFAFVPECDHKPLSWVTGVYVERIELGKDGKGLVLKITLNSVYGTFADTISADSIFASVPWAAIITATVRSWMLKIMTEYPSITVGFATDGAILTEDITTWNDGQRVYGVDETDVLKHDAETGAEVRGMPLGALGSEGTLTNCLMIQPGMYTADEGPAKKRHRTRGHNMDELLKLRADLASEWDWHGWDGAVSYERTRFIGAKQAVALGYSPKREKPADLAKIKGVYGQWISRDVDISFKPSSRQMLPSKEPAKPSIATHRHLYNEAIPTMSSPYNKLVALETHAGLLAQQEENETQPEF